jgi:hypothetical protein
MRGVAGGLKEPRRIGLVSGVGAVVLGICYLAAAGAPVRMVALNLAALFVGLAAFATLTLPRWQIGRARRLFLPALGALLLVTALFGMPVEGAARWARVGPLSLQVSLIVLPVMLVHFARKRDLSGAAGLALAALALALQPDRAMAGVLTAALGVLALRRAERPVYLALAAAALGFGAALLQPDNLPAVPFVDQILFTAFSVHAAAGAAVVVGALLLLAPAVSAAGGGEALRTPALVFGATWAAVIVAAALGNYPTPVVGYGGSAIVGYLLSVALLPRRVAEASAAASSIEAAEALSDEPMLREGLV